MFFSDRKLKIWAIGAVLVGASAAVGCNKDKDAVSSVQPDAVSGKEGYSKTVYPFVRTNCIQCHGSTQIPLFASAQIDTAYPLAYGLVNFAEIASSKFVMKVKDGHCGGACTSDGNAMIDLISTWKTYYNSKKIAGEEVDRGTYFTTSLPIPPMPPTCNPDSTNQAINLAGSPDPVPTPAPTSVLADGTPVVVQQSVCWIKLHFPLKDFKPAPSTSVPGALDRAYFSIDIAYENRSPVIGTASYTFKNPRIVSPDHSVYAHSLKTFINGKYRPEYGAIFHDIDMVTPPAVFSPDPQSRAVPPAPYCRPLTPFPAAYDPGPNCLPNVPPLYSTAASATGVMAEKHVGLGAKPDTIGFSFTYLQEGIDTPCKNLALFQDKVFTPIQIGALLCLNCHKNGGDVTSAGQRFNMDPAASVNNDPKDPRGLTGIDKVCQRFLQRSNLASPIDSPIIVQPEKGMNGMPAQLNFAASFSGCWVTWIKNEKCLLDNNGDATKCPWQNPTCY